VNANSYLSSIVKKYSILGEERLKFQSRVKPLYRELRKWANDYIVKIIPSGSFLKGTAIKGGAVDIDLLISLKNQTPYTLKEIYESLYDFLNQSYFPRKQNVSIGIVYNGVKVDLVPAKKQPNVSHPHSIYVSKLDTWTKTNIHKHINIIKKSPHRNIIKLLKIWCNLNGLDFPSFLLELTVLETLKKRPVLGIERKFLTVLKYIIEEFEYVKIYDPANTNNIVSDTITGDQKLQIIQMARSSYESDCWEKIVWGLYEIRK
jgi:predicted nucleotidyltransferase